MDPRTAPTSSSATASSTRWRPDRAPSRAGRLDGAAYRDTIFGDPRAHCICPVDAALRAVTAAAARHLGLADSIGTLEPGKQADLTILESDPYSTDPEKIMAIAVSETWVAGDQKHGLG